MKKFTKLSILFASFAMAIGVGLTGGAKGVKAAVGDPGDSVTWTWTASTSAKIGTTAGSNTLAGKIGTTTVSISATSSWSGTGTPAPGNYDNTNYGGQQMGTGAKNMDAFSLTFGNPWSGTGTYKDYTKITSVSLSGSCGKDTIYTVSSTIDGTSATNTNSTTTLYAGIGKTPNTCTFVPTNNHDSGVIVINVNKTNGSKAWYLTSISITAEVPNDSTPLKSLTLTGAPSQDISIGDSFELGYTGVDTNDDSWTGAVTYESSNTNVIAVSGNKITAVGAGKSDITVKATGKGENNSDVTSEAITVTVLQDPERVNLPNGEYTVTLSKDNLSGDGMLTSSASNVNIPFEIKAKEGRTWYKNIELAFAGGYIYNNTYIAFQKNGGTLTINNNSNATISTATVVFQNDNSAAAEILVNNVVVSPKSTVTTTREYEIDADSFTISAANNSNYTNITSIEIKFVVEDTSKVLNRVELEKVSATETSFYVGDEPSNKGLKATAYLRNENGTEDVESIDVTSKGTWKYSIETISKNTSSYTVKISYTYRGTTLDSNTVTIDGFTVSEKEYLGGLKNNGKFFLIVGGHVLKAGTFAQKGADTYTTSDSSTEGLTEDDAWIFTTTGTDNQWYIKTSTGSYLYAISNNNGLISGNTADSWTVEEPSTGTYNMIDTNQSRYISYTTNTSSSIRTYANTATGTSTVEFVEYVEGDTVAAFVADWKAMRDAGENGICDYLTSSENNTLKALLDRFMAFSAEDQATIRATADEGAGGINTTIGTTIDYMASIRDWVKDTVQPAEGAGLTDVVIETKTESNSLIALFAVLGLVTISAYYFLEKKKVFKR